VRDTRRRTRRLAAVDGAVVNPAHNADGNERVTLVSHGFQHGPVGGRAWPNAQGLNINRDNISSRPLRHSMAVLNDLVRT
jgi:hypothetical protein